MVLPAILAGAGRLAAGLFSKQGLAQGALGFGGALAPGVIDSLVSSKSEDEARAILAPEKRRMMSNLIAQGIDPMEAESQVDEEMRNQVMSTMQEGSLPGWLNAALSVGGFMGGAALGKKLFSKAAASAGDAAKGAQAINTPKLGYNPSKPRSETTVTDAAYARRMDDIRGANYNKAQTGAFDNNMQSQGGGSITPYVREVDEIIPPFSPSRGTSPRMVDAEFSFPPEAARQIRYNQPKLLTQEARVIPREPIGSGVPPLMKTPREQFREEIAAAERAALHSNPRTPPIIKPREIEEGLMLPFDEERYLYEAMRRYPELF